MQQDEVCGHTLARTTHWALAWRKENFTHNGNGQSSRGEGGWGWSGKGLHLRNCGRGADSLFWPGSTNSGNLSSCDSGVGGGASLRKAPRRQKSSRRFQAAFLIYFGWVPIMGGRRGASRYPQLPNCARSLSWSVAARWAKPSLLMSYRHPLYCISTLAELHFIHFTQCISGAGVCSA